jgi:hypothetical protein
MLGWAVKGARISRKAWKASIHCASDRVLSLARLNTIAEISIDDGGGQGSTAVHTEIFIFWNLGREINVGKYGP